MPKLNLTAAACLAAQCEPGKKRTDYWDLTTTGFVLECRSTGGKSYTLRYFDAHGRQRQHKIGIHGEITFDQARRAAIRLRSEVVLGGDPAGTKDTKKATISYADLAAQHLEYAATYQKRPENTDAVLRVHILPRWGKLRLDEITPQEIAKWLGQKRANGLAPATVEKIRITFNRSFELALKWNLPGITANPVRGITRPKFSNQRSRYLTAGEAQRLFRAVERSANPQLKHIVGLLLLTGARKNELLKAQWQHVDFDRHAWFIPDSKTGKSRHVPLSQAAVDILGKLPRWGGCPWLLPNPATLKPYTDIKRAWMTARDEAQLPDVRIHDLRHSFASFAVNAGVDLFAVGKVLGHADHQSTMRYSHLANDTLMAAVEAGAAKMAGGQAHAI
jgi:integrase